MKNKTIRVMAALLLIIIIPMLVECNENYAEETQKTEIASVSDVVDSADALDADAMSSDELYEVIISYSGEWDKKFIADNLIDAVWIKTAQQKKNPVFYGKSKDGKYFVLEQGKKGKWVDLNNKHFKEYAALLKQFPDALEVYKTYDTKVLRMKNSSIKLVEPDGTFTWLETSLDLSCSSKYGIAINEQGETRYHNVPDKMREQWSNIADISVCDKYALGITDGYELRILEFDGRNEITKKLIDSNYQDVKNAYAFDDGYIIIKINDAGYPNKNNYKTFQNILTGGIIKNNERFVWMAIPNENKNNYKISNVKIFPDNYVKIEKDERGNQLVLWDRAKHKGDEFKISFDVEKTFGKDYDISKFTTYKGSDDEILKYLKSSNGVRLEDREVKNLYSELLTGDESVNEAFIKVAKWTNTITDDGNVISPDATTVINTKNGACGSRASVMCAMFRKFGIPTRTVSGITPPYDGKNFVDSKWPEILGTHVWLEVYFEDYGWVMIEPMEADKGVIAAIREAEPFIMLNIGGTKMSNDMDFWFHTARTGNSENKVDQAEEDGEFYVKASEVEKLPAKERHRLRELDISYYFVFDPSKQRFVDMPYIWMPIPVDIKEYALIEDVKFFPRDPDKTFEDKYGNKYAIWDNRKPRSKKAEKYGINLKSYTILDRKFNMDKWSKYTGRDPEILAYLESDFVVDTKSKYSKKVFNEVYNGSESVKDIVIKAAKWGVEQMVELDEHIGGENLSIASKVFARGTDCCGPCDARASTTAALLRMNGIPARIISGVGYDYAPLYNKTDMNRFAGHVWVEAYFEEDGWVMLEPADVADGLEAMVQSPKVYLVTNRVEPFFTNTQFWFPRPMQTEKMTTLDGAKVRADQIEDDLHMEVNSVKVLNKFCESK